MYVSVPPFFVVDVRFPFASRLDTEFVRVAREVVTELVEGSQMAPEMTSGFTDSRIYRKRGVEAYGFVPCLVSPEELAGIHGHNERISVENLRLGMQILYEIVHRMCAKESLPSVAAG